MDKRYEVYCLVDPLFYDATYEVGDKPTDYELARRPVPPGWQRAKLEDWLMLHPENVQLPAQGWKVHVSACLDNAEHVLDTVSVYCVAHGMAFKFLRSPDVLLLANAKYANRASSGKFIAIYPADEAQLEAVLTDLGEALAGSEGPYILSDLRWGNGPLYVRYGGFAERWCIGDTGTLELAVEDPDGRLVPDRREPRFSTPPWVELPAFLEPHLAARNSLKVDNVPYRFTKALHFSNGGGVYVGEDVETGEEVIIKEARPYAGLDMDGTDAVTRLHREREMLDRLAGLSAVPAVRGTFTVGDHHFLAIELVVANALRSATVERYPLVQLDPDERARAEYTDWALAMCADVERAVTQMHERGVVVMDLHPDNILIRPDGRVVLIDFEVAALADEPRRQTMAEPGFAAPHGYTGFDLDRWALACLRLYLFLPMTSLFGLDAAKAEDFAAIIAETFPVPAEFLDAALRVLLGWPPERAGRYARQRHQLDPARDGWEDIRASLAGAVLASATPQRDDRLFPGDIAQFETGGLSVAYGAAGVLYALDVTGAGRYPEHEEWLLGRALHPKPGTTRLGFYDGLHGVAHVLDRLGHRTEALKVVDLCTVELDGRFAQLGSDLQGGLSGIGLNLAHFAELTGDAGLRALALEVAQEVADRLGDEESVGTVSGGTHPLAGLMYGSTGPALLFLHLYEQGGPPELLDLARTALQQDLRRCLVREDGAMEVNEGWRTMPYLADGSVGIGLVLDRYLTHRPDEQFTDASAAIHRAAMAEFYIQSGLFTGRGGMILYLASRPESRDLATESIRRMAWHALDYRGHAAFPGEELLRLSMDLATGTAGALLAIGAVLHPEPVHLPFLASRSFPA